MMTGMIAATRSRIGRIVRAVDIMLARMIRPGVAGPVLVSVGAGGIAQSGWVTAAVAGGFLIAYDVVSGLQQTGGRE